MSTVGGDGDVEPTQVLSEGDLEEVEGDRSASERQAAETTRVMEDSQLRELVHSGDAPQPSGEQEAAVRERRDAERAAREREEALARVRAHRRQSAQTRALRPAGAVPPEAKVSLSRNALDMLEHEIEPSSRPPAPAALQSPAEPEPSARPTTRPPRDTASLRSPGRVPPPAPTPRPSSSHARMQQLVDALEEVEKRLHANDVQGALEIVKRVRRG